MHACSTAVISNPTSLCVNICDSVHVCMQVKRECVYEAHSYKREWSIITIKALRYAFLCSSVLRLLHTNTVREIASTVLAVGVVSMSDI